MVCDGILHDCKGNIIFGFSFHLGKVTSMLVEVQGLLKGLQICYTLNICNILVETDSKMLVRWYSNKSDILSYFLNLCDDVLC